MITVPDRIIRLAKYMDNTFTWPIKTTTAEESIKQLWSGAELPESAAAWYFGMAVVAISAGAPAGCTWEECALIALTLTEEYEVGH